MPSFEGKFSPEDIVSAGIVARNIELDNISMIEGGFSLRPQPEPASALSAATIEMNAGYEFREPEDVITVRVSFSVRFKPDAVGMDDGSVFSASAIFLLRYRLTVAPPPIELRERLFRGFAWVNGGYNAWPYLREFIQSSAARAGFLPVTLPVFRVPRVQPSPPGTTEAPEAPARPLTKKRPPKKARPA